MLGKRNKDEVINLEGKKYYKKLYTEVNELFNTAMGELHYEKMLGSGLLSILNEIDVLSDKGLNSKLINKIIKNGLERYNLDKLIHAGLLFNNNK